MILSVEFETTDPDPEGHAFVNPGYVTGVRSGFKPGTSVIDLHGGAYMVVKGTPQEIRDKIG